MKGENANMKVLICNVGSTSLKYRLFDMSAGESVLAFGRVERVGSDKAPFTHTDHLGIERLTLGLPSHREAISKMISFLVGRAVEKLEDISCVGFKVVHAKGITGVQELNKEVLAAMAAYNTVTPAHNPPYISAIRQFMEVLPGVPLIGSFETGFHRTMPPEAYLYSLPIKYYKEYGIRRDGFHGASHEYVSEVVAKKMGGTDLRLISCHLGGTGSLCAIKNGKSMDITLGMSLQCGIMHNNRIGDIDPYITFYLMEDLGMSLEEVKYVYAKESGFLGMSGGISGDLRDIELAADAGNEDAKNTINYYCYNIKKNLGGYAAAMGGLDALAFTAGIGENSATVRRLVCQGLEFLGIYLDEEKNQSPPEDGIISKANSPVKIFRIFTNEEIVVARKAIAYLTQNFK